MAFWLFPFVADDYCFSSRVDTGAGYASTRHYAFHLLALGISDCSLACAGSFSAALQICASPDWRWGARPDRARGILATPSSEGKIRGADNQEDAGTSQKRISVCGAK